MRINLLGGAIENAGDFLIEERTKNLLRANIPNVTINRISRAWVNLSSKIEELNDCDCILFAGGPLFSKDIYPRGIPFVDNLSDIVKPIFFLGGGLGNLGLFSEREIYKKQYFTPFTKQFLNKSVNSGFSIGCRDLLTYRMFLSQGYKSVIMTGCPAWYDLENINTVKKTKHHNCKFKICVSDPANKDNIPLLIDLLIYLREKYPESDLSFIIHRETKDEYVKLIEENFFEHLNISVKSIAGSSEGFSVYDNCDMHIGFRLHSHIYNLSKRNISFLFNEDIRGGGFQNTVGLESINIERFQNQNREKHLWRRFYLTLKPAISSYLDSTFFINKLDILIQESMNCNYENFERAYLFMKNTYSAMQEHIAQLRNI